MFLLDDKIVEVLLQGELIAKSKTIIKETESNLDVTVVRLLAKSDEQFVVVVTDVALFAPYGLPRFVERSLLLLHQFEAIHQRGSILELKAQLRGFDDCFTFISQFVERFALRSEGEVHFQLAVGRCQFFGLQRTSSYKSQNQTDAFQP